MEGGDFNFTNREMFSSSNLPDWQTSYSMDSDFNLDDYLKDTHACTHTHACNPPGPDNSHTHTCYHVHTKLVVDDDKGNNDTSNDTAESQDKKSKKRPVGNREAVRKYREKKKARAASLEDEVVELRALNQQLLKRVQGQAVLEAEIARLKCLLVDIRGRIEGEIGSFPYQKVGNPNIGGGNLSLPGGYVVAPCNVPCGNDVYCLHPGADGKVGDGEMLNGTGFSNCDVENVQCLGNQVAGVKELPGCGIGSGATNVNTSGTSKRRGSARVARAG